MKQIIMEGKKEENWRYRDLHEDLEAIIGKVDEKNPQLNELLENQRWSLRMNTGLENAMERNNETTQMLDANIEKVKELFEERIQEVQHNINEARNQRSTEKVVEILENGQERICKEIQENNNEMRMIQERVLTNMKLFFGSSTQEIKEIIIESRNMEDFNDFTQRLMAVQDNMKEFSRMENQHGEIFRKEDENAQELIKIREEITEERKILEENTITLKEVQEKLIKVDAKENTEMDGKLIRIIESQERLRENVQRIKQEEKEQKRRERKENKEFALTLHEKEEKTQKEILDTLLEFKLGRRGSGLPNPDFGSALV
jgi:hypothetical protein